MIIDVIHLANPDLKHLNFAAGYLVSPRLFGASYVGMCGPILVVNLLHVWTVCCLVKRLLDRNQGKPA